MDPGPTWPRRQEDTASAAPVRCMYERDTDLRVVREPRCSRRGASYYAHTPRVGWSTGNEEVSEQVQAFRTILTYMSGAAAAATHIAKPRVCGESTRRSGEDGTRERER